MVPFRPTSLAALAAVMLLALPGCGASPVAATSRMAQTAVRAAEADYFPLSGRTWVYQVEGPGAAAVTKTVKTEDYVFVARNVNVEHAVLVSRVDGKEVSRQPIRKDGTSLTIGANGPTLPLAKLAKKGPLVSGYVHSATNLGNATVKTPAGTFKAVKIELVTEMLSEVLYLAPGVGVVKRTVGLAGAEPHTVETLTKTTN